MPKYKFYFIRENKYSISTLDACAKSERTIDLCFFDLANNEKLLDCLNLFYFSFNRVENFCNYLGAFQGTSHKELLDNPIIRILIANDELLKGIKNLMASNSK